MTAESSDGLDVDVDAFRRDGCLVVRLALSDDRLEELEAAVRRLERRAVDGEHGGHGTHGLHHFEQTDAGAVLARSEDFVHDDPLLHDFICSGLVVEILGQLFGEPAVLF